MQKRSILLLLLLLLKLASWQAGKLDPDRLGPG